MTTKRTQLPAALVDAGEAIDHLITADISLRGAISFLYRHAREETPLPLTLAAAHALLEGITERGTVFIATGWLDRPHIALEIAETDGPPGAAVLGRALQRAFDVIPVFLVEESLVSAMTSVVEAAGLKVLSPDAARRSVDSRAPISGSAVLAFPANVEEATRRARELIDQYEPSAVIAVEKGGMNENGTIHTSRGDDTSEHQAKADLLMRAALNDGIPTIGIGDGGNEIGMGRIQDAIRDGLPFGELIAPATRTDFLVAASVSNWGAYGVAACLALLTRCRDVFHDAQMEARIIRRCADVGLIDGISGYVEEGVDGLPSRVHVGIVVILAELVAVTLANLAEE